MMFSTTKHSRHVQRHGKGKGHLEQISSTEYRSSTCEFKDDRCSSSPYILPPCYRTDPPTGARPRVREPGWTELCTSSAVAANLLVCKARGEEPRAGAEASGREDGSTMENAQDSTSEASALRLDGCCSCSGSRARSFEMLYSLGSMRGCGQTVMEVEWGLQEAARKRCAAYEMNRVEMLIVIVVERVR